MKAKLLAAVLAAGVSQAALAHANYNGWSVGINGGWVGSAKYNSQHADFNKNVRFNHTVYGLHADWAKAITNGLFYGVGFGIGYHAGNPGKTINEVGSTKVTLHENRKFFAEVATRLGWSMGNSVVYAIAALKGTQIENKAEIVNDSNRWSESKWIWGVAPGVGFDFKVNKNWSFGVEYRYFFEQSRSVDHAQKALKADIKNQRHHDLQARVNYHF
jgi:outer membrane autotransporter protein